MSEHEMIRDEVAKDGPDLIAHLRDEIRRLERERDEATKRGDQYAALAVNAEHDVAALTAALREIREAMANTFGVDAHDMVHVPRDFWHQMWSVVDRALVSSPAAPEASEEGA